MFLFQGFEKVEPESRDGSSVRKQALVPDFQLTPDNRAGSRSRMQQRQASRQVQQDQESSGATLYLLLQSFLLRRAPRKQEVQA